MNIYTITNEYPNGAKVGGIGMYIYGLKQYFGDQLTIDVVSIFPRRFALLKHIYHSTSKTTRIFVHHLFPIGVSAFLLSVFTKRTYSIFLHGNDFDTARGHIWRKCFAYFILKYANNVIVNSHALAQDVKRFCGVQALVIHPWLPKDIESFFETQKRHVYASQEKQVITIARFIPRKGFELMIEVAKHFPEIRFIFAGPENDYAHILQKRIQQEHMENITILLNPTREDILMLYQCASVFAMPTIKTKKDREGFGIVYLEAQYAGLPILASSDTEIKEAVHISLHPYLCVPKIHELVESLQKLLTLSHDEHFCDKLAQDIKNQHTISTRTPLFDSLI